MAKTVLVTGATAAASAPSSPRSFARHRRQALDLRLDGVDERVARKLSLDLFSGMPTSTTRWGAPTSSTAHGWRDGFNTPQPTWMIWPSVNLIENLYAGASSSSPSWAPCMRSAAGRAPSSPNPCNPASLYGIARTRCGRPPSCQPRRMSRIAQWIRAYYIVRRQVRQLDLLKLLEAAEEGRTFPSPRVEPFTTSSPWTARQIARSIVEPGQRPSSNACTSEPMSLAEQAVEAYP